MNHIISFISQFVSVLVASLKNRSSVRKAPKQPSLVDGPPPGAVVTVQTALPPTASTMTLLLMGHHSADKNAVVDDVEHPDDDGAIVAVVVGAVYCTRWKGDSVGGRSGPKRLRNHRSIKQ